MKLNYQETAIPPAPNAADEILKNVAIAVPLKYLSKFWRSLEIPLIIYEVKLKITWTKHCVLPVAVTDNTNGNNEITFFLLSKTQNFMFL